MRRKRGDPTREDDLANVIDISVKALIREVPHAILRLAGVLIDPSAIRVEDSNINLPELRADQVFILDREYADQQTCWRWPSE